MKNLSLLLISGFCLFSCGRIENSSSQDKALYSPRQAGTQQHKEAIAIISAKCAECHGSWVSYSDTDFVSTGLVTPQNANSSKIYYRNQLGPGPQNNMPSGGRAAMTSDELQTISTWINSITP